MYGIRKTNRLIILNGFTVTGNQPDCKPCKYLNQTKLIGRKTISTLNCWTTTNFVWWCTGGRLTRKNTIDYRRLCKPRELGFTSYISYLDILLSQSILPTTTKKNGILKKMTNNSSTFPNIKYINFISDIWGAWLIRILVTN